MKKKLYSLFIFSLIYCVAFAGTGDDNKSQWYEVAGTLAALLATIIGIALSLSQFKISRPGSEKLNLEIENLKLDIEEKRLKLHKQGKYISETQPVEKEEKKDAQNKSLYADRTGVWLFSKFAIGFLALLLPVVLVLGSMLFGGQKEIMDSMGSYYYTNMRDIYVGTHLVIAVTLFSYLGYGRRDYLSTKIQGLFCLLIGFCPTGANSILSTIHYLSFSLFLISQSFVSMFLFTKSDSRITKQKMFRNKIYRISGIVILICLILLALYSIVLSNVFPLLRTFKPVFYLEAIAFWAFGISWLLKGEFILKDEGS